jgi:hypothetical protein
MTLADHADSPNSVASDFDLDDRYYEYYKILEKCLMLGAVSLIRSGD